jgi:uncharacterized protein
VGLQILQQPMFKRDIEKELKDLAKGYPVVMVIGPRQSGKTTLVRRVFPKKPYMNLEDPDIRNIALTDRSKKSMQTYA